jgi:stearoyl-CoA desaturase (delta-9 desaturase)
MFLLHHVTWSVSSICHTFGHRAFETTDRSHNQWMVGLLALGEGWHNNHHAFPRSAVHGLDRWQLDLSATLITTFERLGLATNVQRIAPEALARKRLQGALERTETP